MKRHLCLTVVFGLAILSQSPAFGQWYRNTGRVVYPPRIGVGYYGGGYYGGYGGTTAAESYQRGMADVVRARGAAAQNYSKARVNNEEARKKYIENKEEWSKFYWERKRRGEAELAKDYEEDRQRREKWKAATRGRKPETLPPSQLDPQTGGIDWPDALLAAPYDEERRQIEEELATQAATGTTSNSSVIRSLARQMQATLKDHIQEMSANEYIASRKFLERLVNQMAMQAS